MLDRRVKWRLARGALFVSAGIVLLSVVADTKKQSSPKKAPKEHLSDAFSFHQANRFAEAFDAYKLAIKGFRPAIEAGDKSTLETYALACHNLAYISHHGLSRTADAEKWFKEATRVSPTYFEAYHNLGQVFHDVGRFSDAIHQFGLESRIRPDLAAPLLSMAKAYHQLGDLDHAASSSKAATKIEPSSSAAWNGAGWFLHLAGRSKESAAVLKKGLKLHPSDAAMLFHRGKALYDMGAPAAAVKALKKSIKLDPRNAEGSLLLGMAQFDLSDSGIAQESAELWRACAESLQAALRGGLRGSNRLVAVNHLSHAKWQVGEHGAAMALVWEGLREDPSFCDLQVRRVQLQAAVCNFTLLQEGTEAVHRLLRQQVAEGRAPTVNPFVQLVLGVGSAEEQRRLAEAFSAEKRRSALQMVGASGEPAEAPVEAGERGAGGGLRVGLMSADWREHPMGRILSEVLQVLRGGEGRGGALWRRIVVVCIALAEDADPVAAKVEGLADEFVRVGGLSEVEAVEVVRGLGLDVLLDLNGHTRGGRLRLLALGLAPVQAHYLGFAASMGARFVPWFLADRVAAPPELRGLYSEWLVYLPGCYHAYAASQSPFRGSAARDAPSRGGGAGPVLDAQVHTDRIQAHMWGAWLAVLRATGGVLRLRQGATTESEHTLLARSLALSAHAAEVEGSRLQFLRKVDSKAAHLERLGEGDLFLDTDTYSAHSTALDALWAGLPLLTFPSEGFASRPPSSFLTALQMPELIARDKDEYEALAIRLLRRRGTLQRWRSKLWEQRQSVAPGALFNEVAFLHHLERAIRMMWELRVNGKGAGEQPAMHVVVAPSASAMPDNLQ